MTYPATTTLNRATEAPRGDTPSVLSILFARLNDALAVAIEAERELDHGNGRDPAIDHWLREAERAWDVVFDIRRALHAAPVTQAGHRSLLTMVRIADAVMGSDNMSDFGAADNRLRAATFFRQRLGCGRMPDHVSRMLDQCHAHLSAVVQLDLHRPVCDPDDLPDGLQHAWPDAC